MVPAMDRVKKSATLGPWLGLALGLSLLDLGCSRLSWRRPTHEPAMLGRSTETTDIYAMSRHSDPSAEPASPASTVKVNDSKPATPEAPKAGLEEPSTPPASTEPSPSSGGVALLGPSRIESRGPARSIDPSRGVPHAARMLAVANRPEPATPDPTKDAAKIVAEARAVLNSMANYEVTMRRQERVNGSLLPEEEVVLAIRRDPRAVRLTWPTGPNEGREVIYRADEPGGSMHVKMANPMLPRLTLPPESPMVMRNSRHPVTEAGFDSMIESLENALRSVDAASVRLVGVEIGGSPDTPRDRLVRTMANGELWKIDFDPKTHLPTLVQATDAAGQMLERYQFQNVRPNLADLAATDAFDANTRWGPPRGLLGRVARGNSAETSGSPN